MILSKKQKVGRSRSNLREQFKLLAWTAFSNGRIGTFHNLYDI